MTSKTKNLLNAGLVIAIVFVLVLPYAAVGADIKTVFPEREEQTPGDMEWVQTTQDDFEMGYRKDVDSTSSPGDLKLLHIDNLVSNGDFNDGNDDGVPDSWDYQGTNEPILDYNVYKFSDCSIKMHLETLGESSLCHQTIEGFSINSGDNYTISGWVKAENVEQPKYWIDFSLYLDCYNNANQIVKTVTVIAENKTYDWWRIYSFITFEDLPDEIVKIEFYCLFRSTFTGTVWFDGIMLYECQDTRLIASFMDGSGYEPVGSLRSLSHIPVGFPDPENVEWKSIRWSEYCPDGTSIIMYVQGCHKTSNDWSPYLQVENGQSLATSMRDYNRIRWIAKLSTSDLTVTPMLFEVTVTYSVSDDIANPELPMPPETTEDIHTHLIFRWPDYLSTPQVEENASRYDVYWEHEEEGNYRLFEVKNYKPDASLLMYKSMDGISRDRVIGTFSDEGADSTCPICGMNYHDAGLSGDYDHIDISHEDWFLHGIYGEHLRTLYALPTDNPYMTNPGSVGWQNFCIRRGLNEFPIENRRWDGIALDLCILGVKGYVGYDIMSEYNDFEEWRSDVRDYVYALCTALNSEGKILIPNAGASHPFPTAPLHAWEQIVTLSNGAMEEFFCNADPGSISEMKWYNCIKELEYCGENDKICLADSWNPNHEGDIAWRMYGLASYLLAKKGRYDYYFEGGWDCSKPIWYPEWETKIGHPICGRYFTDGVWQRSYSGGKVLVNPSGTDVFNIPLEKPYFTLDGELVESVDLIAKNGMILLGIPSINVDPLLLNKTLFEGNLGVKPLWIRNDGYGPLSVSLVTTNSNWLSLEPATGIIPPNADFCVNVTFNAHDLEEGMYMGAIKIRSNAQDNPITVPVSLNVIHVNLYGQPVYSPGDEIGYFIWVDDNDWWHIRWTAERFTQGYHNFQGTISCDKGFSTVSSCYFEADDSFQTSIRRDTNPVYPSMITFDAWEPAQTAESLPSVSPICPSSHPWEDGIDFQLYTIGETEVVFDLMIDGCRLPMKVYIGSERVAAYDIPFSLLGPGAYRVVNQNTGEMFFGIQEAIDDPETLAGHTIYVSKGTYHESLMIDKPLQLIGENKEHTVIECSPSRNVVYIDNNAGGYVKVTGFTIRGGACGVYVNAGTTIVEGNSISGNRGEAITGPSPNKGAMGVGIYVKTTSAIRIKNNEICDNIWGICTQALGGSSKFIENNLIHSNGGSGTKVVPSQHSDGYGGGIKLENSRYFWIQENNITGNYEGLQSVFGSAGNTIFKNNFIKNSWNAYDTDVNQWDFDSTGNFWSDYTGYDLNGDGIGDIPYDIPPFNHLDSIHSRNQDRHPLMMPYD